MPAGVPHALKAVTRFKMLLVMIKKCRRRHKARPLILLTNDDGFFRETIQVLFRRLGTLGRTYIVAPDREKSACSLAVTLRRPLRVQHIKPRVWAVEGTPGRLHLLRAPEVPAAPPRSHHLGHEPGAEPRPAGHQLLGDGRRGHPGDLPRHSLHGRFSAPGRRRPLRPPVRRGGRADRLAADILANGLPPEIALNVNIPPRPIKGVKITRLGWKFYDPEIIEKTDPRDSSYYWIGTGTPRRVGDAGTDVMAAHAGYISLTPLHTDMTAHHALCSPKLRHLARALASKKR